LYLLWAIRMKYDTTAESDGSLKITIEFGTTPEQQQLQHSFLLILDAITKMQKTFCSNEM